MGSTFFVPHGFQAAEYLLVMGHDMWELRFVDGRGSSFFTAWNPLADTGRNNSLRTIAVAANVSDEAAIAGARKALAEGRTVDLLFDESKVAYAVRHPAPPSGNERA